MEIELSDAYRYAVKNAYLHNGKAQLGAVAAKVAALHKGADVKGLIPLIKKVVDEVNSLGAERLAQDYAKFEEQGYELKAQVKEAGLSKISWAEDGGKVVTRFAPNPNAPFHLGNSRAAILSAEYAKMYKGEFILRFDDTDPKVKKPIEGAEKLFTEDLSWLGYTPSRIVFASDRLAEGIYYDYMKKIIQMGKAYVCTCKSEEWRELIKKSEQCPCREIPAPEQMKKFEKMMNGGFKEGEAVLRIKTDLNDKDPSVRDWWAAKIVDEPIHPNVKAMKLHVWPSYNFASAIDDHDLEVTLILRGQEHAQNKTKQEFLYNFFGWKYPECIHFGRISLSGAVLSKSKIKAGIEDETYDDWDDPRLGTIQALRRKGFDSRAIVDAIMEVGTRSNDAEISIDKLGDLNKKYIDSESRRMVFLEEPVAVDIVQCPEKEVEKEGVVVILEHGSERIYSDRKSFDGIAEGTIVGMRNLYNVRVKRKDMLQIFTEFAGTAKIDRHIISWVKNMRDVEIILPDNTLKGGAIEDVPIQKGERFYLEKLGYCIVDEVNGRVRLFLTHK